ncbi:MAG: dihydroorotase [SAR86 cluster bacterium]|uniref:Dihydroorotase n=1 Tax=SAR86 cluster bacterium TaxID=2030880 RepID=A0A520MH95_9GAMM|nr:MAG: dihydroorotase [SAR86 cluster bacterium]
MYDLILKNCKIVNENNTLESDIAIKNNRIELIGSDINAESSDVVDVNGRYVIPGLIDDQVHFREPGLTHKGEIATESKAGLAGGVTSYFEMPNVNPTTTTNENLTKKFELASTRSLSNYSFHLGASNTNIEEIKKVDINQAAALKVFMGASTGEMLVDSIDALDDIFHYSPLIVVTHCEDQKTIVDNEKLFYEKFGNDLSAEQHHLIRNVESCYLSSSLAVSLAKKYDSDLHVFHLTTEKEMDLFTSGDVIGKKITAEVCVHHMHFNDSYYSELGNQIKCNPSIKEESDRLALIKALHDNKIDIIATDHAPHTWDEKMRDYRDAPAGLPLVQHGLQILMDFYHQDILSLETIVEKTSHNVAKRFQVKDRGYIREGYYADLAILDIDKPYTVSEENILYKCGWSPFSGKTFNSSIYMTIVNGHVAFKDGQITENLPFGMQIEFDR